MGPLRWGSGMGMALSASFVCKLILREVKRGREEASKSYISEQGTAMVVLSSFVLGCLRGTAWTTLLPSREMSEGTVCMGTS